MLAALGALGGSVISGLFGQSNANKQIALQKQFAQNGIQWKVADAKAAGIHPLAALGAQTHSYSPVAIGTPDFAQAGQAVGRAIETNMDTAGRQATTLALEKAGLENDLIRTQILAARHSLNRAMLPPARPSEDWPGVIPGQQNVEMTPPHQIKPPQQTTHLNTPWGQTIVRAPQMTDAQTWEDAYGESALSPSVIAGWGNFIRDQLHTGNLHLQRDYPALYEWFMRHYGVSR